MGDGNNGALETPIPHSFKRFTRDLGRLADILVKYKIRALLAICGSDPSKLGVLASRLVNRYAKKWRKLGREVELRGLYVYHDEFPDAVKLREVFEYGVSGDKTIDFEYSVYEKSERYLGITVQFLVMDLTRDLKPNDVGRLVGIVEGGGLVVFLTPPWESWDQFKTIFKETLTVPQFPEPRHVFISWFKKKLLLHEGVGIYDADRDRVVKKISIEEKKLKEYKRSIEIPGERLFPVEIYEHALTMDQVNVIKIMEHFYEKPKKGFKKVFVLTADRGRGKSCAVGIGIVGLIHLFREIKPRFRVLVTSPSPGNIQSLMTLASSVLDRLRYRYDVVKKSGYIIEIRSERFSIEYWEPVVIPKLKGDIVVVDEAAGIHVPLLYDILDAHNRLVLSTTIHGYEGAGRGFSVRFLKRIQSIENIELYQYEMTEPIRYNYNDPVEEWQFKTLLLDAEPAELSERDLLDVESKRFIYVKYNPGELFENEEELRQLFGIYVLAHYRNEPDDLGMLADAPHHVVRAVKTTTGKVICAIQIAQEGPIEQKAVSELLKGGKIPGNIIPDRFLKHTRLVDFANTVGWRIVRIATHPVLQGRGIGSWALEKIYEEAGERGLNWLGSGFGVTEELLRFWVKNGFSVIHISPDRNPVSGEYTVLVIRPVDEKTRELVNIATLEFKFKLINSLSTNYRELEPGVVYVMLNTEPYLIHEIPRDYFSPILIDRLWTYCSGPMTFEAAADIMYLIGRIHWLIHPSRRLKLDKIQELFIITKALQGLTWDDSSKLLRRPVKAIQDMGHEVACMYFEYLTGIRHGEYQPGISSLSYSHKWIGERVNLLH